MSWGANARAQSRTHAHDKDHSGTVLTPVAISRGTCSLAVEGPLAHARSRTRKLQHGHVAAYFTPVAPKFTCKLFAHGCIWNRVNDVGCLETARCIWACPLSMNPAGAFQVMEAIGDVLLCPRAIISFAC